MRNKKVAFLALLFVYGCHHNSNINPQEALVQKDTCKWTIMKYPSGEKSSEGLLCGKLREGHWIDWYKNGTLMDSGEFKKGCFIYDTSLVDYVNIDLFFKGNPSKFYKDSVYRFYPKPDQNINFSDIGPYYQNDETRDGKRYLFQVIDYPKDSFTHAIKMIKAGKMTLMFCLYQGFPDNDSMVVRHRFYKREIEVLEK